jgi:importin-5
MSRGWPWYALQAQAFSICQGANPGLGAYRVFSGCPNLVMDLQTDAVLAVFQKELHHAESVEVSPDIILATFFDAYFI